MNRRVKTNKTNVFLRMRPLERFSISLILAVIVFISIMKSDFHLLVKIMISWDFFSLSYIITSLIVFFTRTPEQLMQHAKQEDGSRIYVFFLVVVTSLGSLLTVLVLMLSKAAKDTPHIIYILVAVGGMLFSWIMVHTIFGFRYAHMYYGADPGDVARHAEGLEFPEEKKPDYIDFAYFSFVIGMTFQVSDVEITSRSIRRVVLVHGLLSFGLNTFVVALTINLIAGLMN